MKLSNKSIGDEQESFRRGKACVYQITALKIIAEKCMGKGRKLYAAYMEMKKAYDKADRKSLWDILRIYSVGGQLNS